MQVLHRPVELAGFNRHRDPDQGTGTRTFSSSNQTSMSGRSPQKMKICIFVLPILQKIARNAWTDSKGLTSYIRNSSGRCCLGSRILLSVSSTTSVITKKHWPFRELMNRSTTGFSVNCPHKTDKVCQNPDKNHTVA